jgi:hypothetical protein
MLLQPIDKIINGKRFILSKFPAIAGREIVAQYPFSGMPKIGDYKLNEELMLKLMKYVAVAVDGIPPIQLVTRELVDNHVGDWETLAKIEYEMMVYNCSFFSDGRASDFLDGLAQKAEQWISQMLTASLDRSSQTNTQP